jgi:hypothetical protein
MRTPLARRYLYLIQLDDASDPLDLTTHVLNTEAHPLRVFGPGSVALSSAVTAVA